MEEDLTEGNPYRPASPLTEDERLDLVRHSRMLVFKQEVEHRLRARFLNTTEAMVDEEREQVPLHLAQSLPKNEKKRTA